VLEPVSRVRDRFQLLVESMQDVKNAVRFVKIYGGHFSSFSVVDNRRYQWLG
jgi:hypothetical protein